MSEHIHFDRAQTVRYLKMGSHDLTCEVASRLDAIEKRVRASCRPAYYARLEKIDRSDTTHLKIGPLEVQSISLMRHLDGCAHAFLFCATLGAGVDALLRQLSQTSAADALLAQAVATMAIECYCDQVTEALRQQWTPHETLCARFSPGYGDVPLEVQRPLLHILESDRRAGIVLSQQLLMIPSKSVSAIIGAKSSEGTGV